MIPLTISEVVRATKGTATSAVSSDKFLVTSVSTDTRTLPDVAGAYRDNVPVRHFVPTGTNKPGALFVALKGPNFDGHNFIKAAIKNGAGAILVSRIPIWLKNSLVAPMAPDRIKCIFIKVPDTLKALGDLARYYRTRLTARIIAVTGSNGKTTTKDMLGHILSRHGATVVSPKSFNNFIGVPLTMFNIDNRHRYAVLELGTNKPGEIDWLARIVQPDVAVVTNVGPSHLAGLKNIAGVAKEKADIFKSLTEKGVAIFDADNEILKKFIRNAEYRIDTFGINPRALVRGSNVITTGEGVLFAVEAGRDKKLARVSLPVLGVWNVNNALAAITAARAVGVPISAGCRALASFRLPPMRMERRVVRGVNYINDAYNANPASVSAALGRLSETRVNGRRIFVFGAMRELGKCSREYHRQIGFEIAFRDIHILIGVGRETRWTLSVLAGHPWIKAVYCNNVAQAIKALKKIAKKGDTVLLKGSRAIGLEKILN